MPSVSLSVNGSEFMEGALRQQVLAGDELILEVSTSNPGEFFRGSVIAHSSDHGCAGLVSLQGGYQIRRSSPAPQGEEAAIIDIASIRPGSLLTAGNCVSAPLPSSSGGGVALIGGRPFTHLASDPGPAGEEGLAATITVRGDLGEASSYETEELLMQGEFRGMTERDLFGDADVSQFGPRQLQVCLPSEAQPGEGVYVQIGEFQTDGGGNVQTAQPTPDRVQPCIPSRNILCLENGRFQASVNWSSNAAGGSGVARPLGDQVGTFDFSNDGQSDYDLTLQIIDACEQAGSHWVTVTSPSTLSFTLTVVDTTDQQERLYMNTRETTFDSVFDADTFTNCP